MPRQDRLQRKAEVIEDANDAVLPALRCAETHGSSGRHAMEGGAKARELREM